MPYMFPQSQQRLVDPLTRESSLIQATLLRSTCCPYSVAEVGVEVPRRPQKMPAKGSCK